MWICVFVAHTSWARREHANPLLALDEITAEMNMISEPYRWTIFFLRLVVSNACSFVREEAPFSWNTPPRSCGNENDDSSGSGNEVNIY